MASLAFGGHCALSIVGYYLPMWCAKLANGEAGLGTLLYRVCIRSVGSQRLHCTLVEYIQAIACSVAAFVGSCSFDVSHSTPLLG